MVSVNYLAYKNALKQAWKDGKMSADESAMLDTLRKSLNISPDEHVKIEQDVRIELANNNNGNNNQSQIAENQQPPEQPEQPPEPTPNPDNQAEAAPPPAETMQQDALPTQNNGISDIKTLLIEGKNSYHKGNYEEAIEYCDKVLLLDPDNSEALFFRKRTLSKIEKLRGSSDAVLNGNGALANGASVEVSPPAQGEINGGTAVNVVANNSAPSGGGGKGDPNCKSCRGSGECHWCKGSGSCYWCKGTGKCDKCNGSGEINGESCKSCKGGGKCHSCTGDGKCYWCHGSGTCSKCLI